MKGSISGKTARALDLATQSAGASSWLTVLPIRGMNFDVRVCHPNAGSYSDSDPYHIFRQHETEKKRQYASRMFKVEQATFKPLVFSMTGGMAVD